MKKTSVVTKEGKFWTGGGWSREFPDAEQMGRREAKNTASIMDAKAIDCGDGDLVLADFEITNGD